MSRGSLIDDEDLQGGDEAFLFQEQRMQRSQSAAPLLRESKSLGPPPGYAMGQRSASNDMNVGLQRSASTGVIGGHQKSSSSVLRSLGLDSDGSDLGAVRPAPKTLMDLIQEDFPSSPSPMYKPDQQDDTYRSELPRPRTASPPSQYDRVPVDNARYEMEQQERARRLDNGRYGMEQHEWSYRQQQQQNAMGDITHSMDRMCVNGRDDYAVSTLLLS